MGWRTAHLLQFRIGMGCFLGVHVMLHISRTHTPACMSVSAAMRCITHAACPSWKQPPLALAVSLIRIIQIACKGCQKGFQYHGDVSWIDVRKVPRGQLCQDQIRQMPKIKYPASWSKGAFKMSDCRPSTWDHFCTDFSQELQLERL